ncbi:UNVERIFIED_CONTAM: hypothetical protein Sangu_0071200 [Sesamum angustifolium]|uniref:BRCT domain-containing protein n=1 Tax=Sesamum angustifolium TaxID=2727405 RepID=A0AAW2RJ93_9LAMI
MELERPVNKNEVLRHVETVNFSEAVADAIELCIAASEALVINEVIKSNSFAEPSTASAILEAALQVKQARLEAWKTRLIGFTDEISEVDNLSDLDDITMESAYEDAGIHFNELVRNEVSVSQVKDTFDSECEENVKHEKTHASATIFRIPCADRYTYRMKGVTNNVIQLRKELATECFDGDTKKKVINPVCDLGTDVSYHSDCLRTVEAQAKLLLQFHQRKATDLQWKILTCKECELFPIKSCHGCSTRAAKRSTRSSVHLESKAPLMDKFLKVYLDKEKKSLIFQNMEFLLTGLSEKKEKEIEGLIRKYGGIVISQIPVTNLKGKRSSRFKSGVLPIVLCLKKIQSLKFLYGCAVNALVLKVNWLIDSIAVGFVLPTEKYMVLSRNISRWHDQVYPDVSYNTNSLVFNNLGVMLHGKTKYFTNIAAIIKHGGGQVFKTLQRLIQTLEAGRISIAVIVADGESSASRHLKHCALEQNIPMTVRFCCDYSQVVVN